MAFKKAQCEQAALKIGMYGPPGSGKTFTSLLIAEGLAGVCKKKVAVVDTERGTDFYSQKVKTRAVHQDAFDFDVLHTRSLMDTLQEIEKLDLNEYGVVILDSISHLWDAAINAWEGHEDENGDIPIHLWGRIKRPYKQLMAFLISTPLHVIICGRQADQYEGDQKIGLKMRAEKETLHDPHLNIRLATTYDAEGVATYNAHIEKDRTGILSGTVIKNPTFEKLCQPLLPLLGKTQAGVERDDITAAKDQEAISRMELAKAQISATYRDEFIGKFLMAKSQKELDAAAKEITPQIRTQLTSADNDKVKLAYKSKSW
jgi:hypothetical protein